MAVHHRWRQRKNAAGRANTQADKFITVVNSPITRWEKLEAVQWVGDRSKPFESLNADRKVSQAARLTKPFDNARSKQGVSGFRAFAYTTHKKCLGVRGIFEKLGHAAIIQ